MRLARAALLGALACRSTAFGQGLPSLKDAPPAADAPFVPAGAAATPEDALGRLRAGAASGADDRALGEAYDFLRRWPSRPESPEVRLAAGALHLRRGEAERSLAFLEDAARAGPVRSRAVHLLGAALLSLGRDEEVLRAVPAADAADAGDRWLALAQVWRAAAEERLGRGEESAARYRAVVASGEASPVRAYALAAVAADWDRRRRPERARDALSRAAAEAERWRLDDLRDALALAGASALARAGRRAESAAAYADFARRFPASPLVAQARYERGLALKRLGKLEEAAESFDRLVRDAPGSAYAADAHLQLGQLLTELGRADEALAHYRSMAASSEGKDAGREALLLMAQVHYNAKRWRDAAPLYRRYLKDGPPEAKARQVRGLLLVSLWNSDREDPELAALAAALPEHPLVGQVRRQLAASAYKRGDWAGAEELFRRALEAAPRAPGAAEARFFRAEALRQLGRSSDAADAYRGFLAEHPRDARAREAASRLGALLFEAGDSAGAAKAYAGVAGSDAVAADAAHNRALALAKSGAQAAAAWESFAGRFPSHERASWAWREAGRLREEEGRLDEAVRDYERAPAPADRAACLYAIGRVRERQKRTDAAISVYERLRGASPKDDPARLSGVLRLALLRELKDRPREAAPLYVEVMRLSPRGSASFETARKRLEALTKDKSLVGR